MDTKAYYLIQERSTQALVEALDALVANHLHEAVDAGFIQMLIIERVEPHTASDGVERVQNRRCDVLRQKPEEESHEDTEYALAILVRIHLRDFS